MMIKENVLIFSHFFKNYDKFLTNNRAVIITNQHHQFGIQNISKFSFIPANWFCKN